MKHGLLAFLAAALFIAGCGSSEGGHAGHSGADEAGSSTEGSVPGRQADASNADRTIQVETLDELRFDPASIQLEAGDVVTFVVTNSGTTEHEFVLGDESYQDDHGSEMDHDMGTENAISVAPGETKELTWEFDEAGEVLYGCHVDGHYDGGMVGTIEVS